MLLTVIFIYCFSVVTANYDPFNAFLSSFSMDDGNQTVYRRSPRDAEKDKDFKFSGITCENMANTARTPFVVLLLFKSSGRFLGMGSIISRKTVLTAAKVVENSMRTPRELLCLAGRLGPWWGKGSQVKEADEIFVNDMALALVTLREPFIFNKNISPVKLAEEEVENYVETYTEDYAVFGITRSSWDVPGDRLPKSARYIMKVETIRDASNGLEECKQIYPDRDFDDNYNICTSANGTFCWGCIGSPTIALTSTESVLQIGVVTKTTQLSDSDKYHVHTKIGPYSIWLKSHSLMEYKT